jgi:ribulose-phosphate 3-epimerase
VTWREWARPGVVEPSIYAADFSRLGELLESLLDAGARVFHFDIGDGHFIGEITIGPIVLGSIAPLVHERGGVLDCHLMVSQPERHFESVRAAGGDSVTFHVEVVDDPAKVAAHARELGLGVGVAFNPDTEVERAAAAAADMDLALCMSIHPGLSGQAFMSESLGRIEKLRSLVPDSALVQVDGGVSAANAAEIREAGADLLVAGSAVFWQDDPATAYLALTAKVAEAVA